MTDVERRADAVVRAAGPWTPSVHAFLRHLRAGLGRVPEPLGRLTDGREVLSFVEGEVPEYRGDVERLRACASAPP